MSLWAALTPKFALKVRIAMFSKDFSSEPLQSFICRKKRLNGQTRLTQVIPRFTAGAFHRGLCISRQNQTRLHRPRHFVYDVFALAGATRCRSQFVENKPKTVNFDDIFCYFMLGGMEEIITGIPQVRRLFLLNI